MIKFEIDTLYLNEHSEHRGKIKLNLNKSIEARIIKQTGKNKLDIEHNRVIIPLDNYYLLCNLYRKRNRLDYFLKALTILTPMQLKVSRNLNGGKFEPYLLSFKISKIKYEDKFFDYKYYEDWLNQPKEDI